MRDLPGGLCVMQAGFEMLFLNPLNHAHRLPYIHAVLRGVVLALTKVQSLGKGKGQLHHEKDYSFFQ